MKNNEQNKIQEFLEKIKSKPIENSEPKVDSKSTPLLLLPPLVPMNAATNVKTLEEIENEMLNDSTHEAKKSVK